MDKKLKQSLAEQMMEACGIDDVDGPDTVEDWVEKIFLMGQKHQFKIDVKAVNSGLEPMRAPQEFWDRLQFIISNAAPRP